LQKADKDKVDICNARLQEINSVNSAIKKFISNNPVLFLPIKDNQVIDISLAVLFLIIDNNNHQDIKEWLSEIIRRSDFAFLINEQYPCNLNSYSELLKHPQIKNEDYKQEVTGGSVLFSMIAFWAALLKDDELYNQVQALKKQHLEHCNFQLWYPTDDSEQYFYKNSNIHGATLSHVCIDQPIESLLKQILDECEQTDHFHKLSAIEIGCYPIILLACRHYKLPLPPHFFIQCAINGSS
jgi:hypothetical protein